MECETEPIACQLALIVDSLAGFDLNGFLGTLLATVIGAAVATGSSLWLANRERPVPMWRVETDFPADGGRPDRPTVAAVPIRLLNIGDGVAYNVETTVMTAGAEGRFATAATLRPGAALDTTIDADMNGRMFFDIETGGHLDSRALDWPAGAALAVAWQQPPRRRRVRHARLALRKPSL